MTTQAEREALVQALSAALNVLQATGAQREANLVIAELDRLAAPPAGEQAQPVAITEVMRHVRRLQRHVDEWCAWYGKTDVLLRNQLPLPPAGTVRIMEDLETAIAAAPAPPSVPSSVQALITALKEDPDYAWTWHCNVACAMTDEGVDHATANRGAARFMRWFAGVDPAYPLSEPAPSAQPQFFTTPYRRGEIAGDGKPCPNDHDPDCRWPQCNCRQWGQ